MLLDFSHSPLKVILADANDLFRGLLKVWTECQSGMSCVGEVSRGDQLAPMVRRLSPHLLILDPVMPDGLCLEEVGELMLELPTMRVLAVYGRELPFVVDGMCRAGFHGCLCKSRCGVGELGRAVEGVMRGNTYLCAATCRIQNDIYNSASSFVQRLSQREQEILSLVGSGMDNDEIGSALGLSPATVQTHRRNLFRKLEIHDTPSLMRFAIDNGFWIPGTDGRGR